MWNGPLGKMFFRELIHAGRCSHMSGLYARALTAGHDEFRDIGRHINFARLGSRSASDGLIEIGIASLVVHLSFGTSALCRQVSAGSCVLTYATISAIDLL
jgi:hypothetical protein